jgi:hypothetical protein
MRRSSGSGDSGAALDLRRLGPESDERSGMNDNNEGLGVKFWLVLMGICAGAVVAAGIVFVIFGRMWEAWGFFGAFLVLCGVLLLVAWGTDRREANRRKRLAA